MQNRTTRILVALAAFVAGLVLCVSVVLLVNAHLAPPTGARTAAIGGPFHLIDQDGHAVTDADMKGRPFLVFFGFTHCPDVCPTTLFDVSEVMHALGNDADRTGALFITV